MDKKQIPPPDKFRRRECNLKKEGGDLLSRLRSTIGAVGLNFSVRNGKRWNTNAIATIIADIWTTNYLSLLYKLLNTTYNLTTGRLPLEGQSQVSGN